MMAATEGDSRLEADPGVHDDADSAIGIGSIRDSTTSLSSSILKYREENGRTYHAYKDGKYVLPNDEEEMDRLDLQHHLFLMTFDSKLALAPIGKDVHRVLDIGTGTGIWAIDFADEHPESQVIGVDLSPIQPAFTPPNLLFEIDDVEEPWTYTKKFDYIHARTMNACFSNWGRFFEQCLENLEPGGYLEMQDCGVPMRCDDDSWPQDSPLWKWNEYLLEAGAKLGRPLDICQQYKNHMIEAGFEDVVEIIYRWPSNQWPKDPKYKELGAWSLVNIDSGVEGMTMALFTRGLGWSNEEVQVFLAGVRKDIKNRNMHTYWPIHVVYGRKAEKSNK